MSTYYAICCDRCKVMTDFVGVWAGSSWGWMAGAPKPIPAFMAQHADHLAELKIINEHDDRYSEYEDLTPDDEA